MKEALRGLGRSVAMMLSRAVLRASNDASGLQEMQLDVLANETASDVQRPQNYGLTSRPHPGAEAVVGCLGGARDNMVVLVVDDRTYRLRGLKTGEVALYDDRGAVVHMTRDGLVISDPAQISMSAPEIHLNAPLVTANGSPVSRIGDHVNVGGGSSSGLWPLVEGADG